MASLSSSSERASSALLLPLVPLVLLLLCFLSRFLAPSSERLTSAISSASAVSSAQTPTSAVAEGARPAGALTAGNASTPAPTDEPTMSATAERTLPVTASSADEKEEAGVEEEGEAAAAAAEERRAVEPLPCSPSPRWGLRSSSEGSRRFLERERERERFFVVFPFSVSLFDNDDDDDEEAAATPPPRRRQCKDRDRSGPSRVSRTRTARVTEAILPAFSTRGRARTGSAERGARGDAPTSGGGAAARAQQHFRDAIARTLGVAMARVFQTFFARSTITDSSSASAGDRRGTRARERVQVRRRMSKRGFPYLFSRRASRESSRPLLFFVCLCLCFLRWPFLFSF